MPKLLLFALGISIAIAAIWALYTAYTKATVKDIVSVIGLVGLYLFWSILRELHFIRSALRP